MADILTKVTGFRLREAIKTWELRRNTASKQFEDARWLFEGESKPALDDLANAFVQAESAIARLQTAQARYNLAVEVDVQGQTMPLAAAVKMVGGAARLEKLWRETTQAPQQYGYGMQMIRTKDQERARPAVDVGTAVTRTEVAATRASALRHAIAMANSVEREVELDPTLLV